VSDPVQSPDRAGPVLVSVVIPAFDEGERLPSLLGALAAAGERIAWPATEFLVVDDGSAPDHRSRYQAAVAAASESLARCGAPHRAELLAAPVNQGKGAAIRLGWSRSARSARWLGFLDADGAVPAVEFWRLAGLLRGAEAIDVLAGTRIRMAGRHIRRSLFRHLQGRVFATFTEHAFRLGFYDTQCGLKLLRAEMLRPLLGELREDRWLLDIEVLALMKGAGARLVEEPVDFFDPGGSKVVFGVDPIRMFLGLWRMRRRLAPRSAAPAGRAG
jgi:dolichyl-phosphate beta-glucosyltransferase